MNEINPRALKILKLLVERYIREGQPVGSKILADDKALALSSATIRNIMAELEMAGFLESPHTSAGRVPTEKGYRLFVDAVLTATPKHELQLEKLQTSLDHQADPKSLVAIASNMLSNLTHLAGLVTLPRPEKSILTQVEFLSLSTNRLLVILVFNDSQVQNRIVHIERVFDASILQQAGNYLTEKFAGKTITAMRKSLLLELQNDRSGLESMLKTILTVAEEAFPEEEDYVIAGEANLLKLSEEAGVERLHSLFDMFTKKRDILHLLDQCLKAEAMQIFIGSESGHEALDSCSMVAAPYKAKGELVGVLGVIGPTRMAYDQVISTVNITSKLLSAALSEHA